jgi:UPF0042 nucleotide-binding protein
MKFIIISGRSGSGKSVALHLLEDLGYYCIDNLPINLLPTLTEKLGERQPLAAVSIDARNLLPDLRQFSDMIQKLKTTADHYEILYFDADNNTLLKRFSETRRKHPLTTPKLTLQEALQQEQQLLQPIAELADLRIDTSRLTSHQLRDLIHERINQRAAQSVSILFQSFGYKLGIPVDADYVFDVRCLPNPYWQAELRSQTGLDSAVADFLQAQPNTKKMLSEIETFLETWIPSFTADNRCYITVAIGCTGGQHRSVYIAEQLAKHFQKKYTNVQVRHREL